MHVVRLVANVMTLEAVLCWVGVTFHVPAFAQLLHDGWRASGTLGYANVAGLLLLIGWLCAGIIARESGRAVDHLRCATLAAAALTTQSRSVLVAVLVCGAVLLVVHRRVAAKLWSSLAPAAVAFAGLLPAVRGDGPWSAFAILSALAAVGLVLGTPWLSRHRLGRIAVQLLPLACGAVGVVLLRSRLLDNGSNRGRIDIWQGALARMQTVGLFGEGPHELAALSHHETVALLVHSDVLQYGLYYGIPGLLGLVFCVYRLGRLSWKTRTSHQRELWVVGVSSLLCVSVVSSVDFPLQVPLVPAVVGLIVGATLWPARAVVVPQDRPNAARQPAPTET
ncbi:hypothetical protein GCM10017567_57500 [Amycolatopsis bullii]|uniref:O-antigen polymerase n=2 Tax=Pseudonocardiaceae TaxID=2070 RepID=A0ABQ3KM46_9PSEU|nr:hypothetical protein GCM10017567_57500 [Amycolatopsis bullii]